MRTIPSVAPTSTGTQMSQAVSANSAVVMLMGALGFMVPALAAADVQEIKIPGERVVPESLTSDRAGNIYIGSIVARTIYRVTKDADTAAPWIQPETDGMQNIYGVFADDASNTLWAC